MFVCIYYGGEWLSKLRLLEHGYKGCDDAPFYPNVSKHVLPMYPNFKSAQETNKLKHMLVIKKGSSHLPSKTQTKIDAKQDQKLAKNTKLITQVC